MGKAVFCNFPAHGGINPLLATASELVKRGEKIIYFCTEEFSEKIEKTGAEFRPYKGKINKVEVINDDMFKLFKLMLEMTVDKLDNNLDSIRDEKPDYIIHDSMCPWGKYFATILNLPAVSLMHTFPVTEKSTPITFDLLPLICKMIYYIIAGKLNKTSVERILKRKYNITLDLRDVSINREGLNIVYTSKLMAPRIYESENTYRFVGPSLFFKKDQTDFPFEKLKGKKVIYISLGTVHNNNLLFYKKCIEAFTKKEYMVIMSVGHVVDINELSNVPGNFIIRTSVPQQQLLEHVSLFITHAGMNGVNEALCCGVPMLLFPHQIEQKMIAKRVNELGVGIQMDIKKISSTKLYQISDQLITNTEYKNQATKYSDLIKAEEKTSHLRAADEILHYIGSNETA